MDCISCGHSNRDQAKFCEGCGASLRRSCPECGAELRPEARFCDACGAALKPAATQGPSSSASRQSMHEGERRVVSVLFADAVGHTPLSERLDEEEVYNLMQGCFARMQESVERYGGTVIQYTGDGILALFGAPVAYEDSARRAVMAGLDMQRSLKEYAEEVKKRHPIECAYRVGINTGPVVVGSISEKLDLDFTAVGDTVNLASRMETLAVAGTVQRARIRAAASAKQTRLSRIFMGRSPLRVLWMGGILPTAGRIRVESRSWLSRSAHRQAAAAVGDRARGYECGGQEGRECKADRAAQPTRYRHVR